MERVKNKVNTASKHHVVKNCECGIKKNLKERDHWEDQRIDGKIILERTLGK
jgi:hypothetical protein